MSKTHQNFDRHNKANRTSNSISRLPANIVRNSILIVTEGTQTEPNYFEAFRKELKLGTVAIQVEGLGKAPINLVEKAMQLRDERAREASKSQSLFVKPKFDEVWCVFDTEILTNNTTFYPAVNKARSNDINLAISSPSFEVWYLLHKTSTTRSFNDSKDVISELKKYIPLYQKNHNIFPLLYKDTNIAIDNAENCYTSHPDQTTEFPNCSTTVYKVVKKLLLMLPY